ncbi:MAG: hypothetical protein HY707_12460 [Ignavibacteriae bacterium]|nr:hypothetical protein [Ignavibacteriota bacterium]
MILRLLISAFLISQLVNAAPIEIDEFFASSECVNPNAENEWMRWKDEFDGVFAIGPLSGQSCLRGKHLYSENRRGEAPWIAQVKLNDAQEQPFAIFGQQMGASPLYVDQTYRFGVYAGDLYWKQFERIGDERNIRLNIKVYAKSAFNSAKLSSEKVTAVHEESIVIPLKPHLESWPALSNFNMIVNWENGYLLGGKVYEVGAELKNKFGLTTYVS